jgi:hypothetical protein
MVDKAFEAERSFFVRSSYSIAIPYLPMFITIAFIFGYGAKLMREGALPDGPILLRVFFGVMHSIEAFGQVS